ncbi:Protein EARLY FLOWERING 4 [Camellia lanceoleosa]|uniref:Protein EARLY FLOWERING 4 n=1 Tax=Camellia lanceoleosa TaxID=1840588 RepID=A0ACC0ITZ2_9ERIC|nr:Protein EARLY FLOWERING 4 [Camellia lanceoleosa]
MADNNHLHLQTLTNSNSNSNSNSFTTTTTTNHHSRRRRRDKEDEDSFAAEGDAAEVWGTFTENFRQVQSVLDRNRVLIQQVNENHQSKIHDNMIKNVALIQEINGNISKVVSLYSDLSTNFSTMFHQRNEPLDSKSKDDTSQA